MHLPLKITVLILALTLVAIPVAAEEDFPRPGRQWFSGDHGSCVACHKPGNTGDDSRPGADTCLGCHENIGLSETTGTTPASYQDEFLSGHVMPAAMYKARLPQGGKIVQERLDCLTCHDPHGGDGHSTALRDKQGPAILSANARVDQVSRFCVGCHEDMSRFNGTALAYSRHPIGLTAVVVHESYLPVLPLADINGTEDRSDDVVACTTCHFVHNGPNKYLLRWDRSIEGRVCGQCHVQGRPKDGGGDRHRMAGLR